MRIEPGVRGEATIVVDDNNTAAAVGSGAVASFSTPALVALMEKAAITAITPYLDQGESSVGTEISLKHLAATPIGFHVVAEAEITAVEGKRVSFAVTARDDRELIGEGTHVRYVVDYARFMERVRQKAAERPSRPR
ncbi:MAG TPA: thioesterase family protein [Dehalococcoidia bacterium]|nr:thioesterase family protein [Dehalococcoidia bacterium]